MEYEEIEQRVHKIRSKLDDMCKNNFEHKSKEYNGLCIVEQALLKMLKGKEKE